MLSSVKRFCALSFARGFWETNNLASAWRTKVSLNARNLWQSSWAYFKEPAQATRWNRRATCRFDSLAEMRIAKASLSCCGLRNEFFPERLIPGWVAQQRVIG